MAKKKNDPILKIAIHEIRQVMEKFDLAGNICLVSKTHAANTIRFPDWTGATVQRNSKGQEVRIEMCIDIGAVGKQEARQRAEHFVKVVNEIGMYSHSIACQMHELLEQMSYFLERKPTLSRMMDVPEPSHSIIHNLNRGES